MAARRLSQREPESADVPLWPNADGRLVSKVAVVDTVRALAAMACPGTDTKAINGHTFRSMYRGANHGKSGRE
eukprot:6464818-Amphidinium_carterae.3